MEAVPCKIADALCVWDLWDLLIMRPGIRFSYRAG